MSSQVIIGRARECQLVLTDVSVSARHARLSWSEGQVLIEDLGSANGVWVDGRKIDVAQVNIGDDVQIGAVPLPWSRQELRTFLRRGGGETLVVPPPASARRRRSLRTATGVAGALVSLLAVVIALPDGRDRLQTTTDRVRMIMGGLPTSAYYEEYVRTRVAPKMRQAIDPSEPLTRDTAVRVASREQGSFRIEQVAAIWGYVRDRWRYVNDPNGREYFASASESIRNGFAGDCDDFAIALATMVAAIGGEPRVVFMEGPRGGHAYAEVCIREEPTLVAAKLAEYYDRHWARYTPAGRPQRIAFRRDPSCPVWLNLDWNAVVPGGDYTPEQWAVAIYPDGHTETLGTVVGQENATPDEGDAPRTLPTPRGQ